MIRIELTWAILMPCVSNFLRNSTIHVRMFLYLVTCFLRVKISLLCRLEAESKIHVPFYPYLISKESKLFGLVTGTGTKQWLSGNMLPCKHKHRRKWMVKFLNKFENRGIKIARVNRILITNLSIYFNFERFWGQLRCLHF